MLLSSLKQHHVMRFPDPSYIQNKDNLFTKQTYLSLDQEYLDSSSEDDEEKCEEYHKLANPLFARLCSICHRFSEYCQIIIIIHLYNFATKINIQRFKNKIKQKLNLPIIESIHIISQYYKHSKMDVKTIILL